MAMKLTGIIESIFDGRYIFRGYARLVDLVNYSEPNPNYQREADRIRVDNLVDFLNGDNPYKFFTEILLGLEFHDSTIMQHLNDRHINGVIKLNDNIKVSEVKLKNANLKLAPYEDARSIQKVISFDFEENATQMSRIDGNHRLCAVDAILKKEPNFENDILKEKVKNVVVPFSILLQVRGNKSEDYEAAIFYLINSNAVPLTKEQNLKALFNTERFNKSELQNIFNIKNASLLIDILNHIDQEMYPTLKSLYDNAFYTCIYKVISLFNARGFETSSSIVASAFQQVDNDWLQNEEFKECNNINIVSAMIYYYSTSKDKYPIFIQWTKSTKIYRIEEIQAETIIELYEKAMNSQIKVFVAMPYYSDEIIRSTNAIYTRVISRIRSKYKVDISLPGEIMTYKGSTINIVNDIFHRIENCDICFCDITNNNPNVTYEMGWARAKNKYVVILKEETAEEPKSDYKLDFYSTFKKDAYITLEEAVEKNIKEILKKHYSIPIED